jgi:hypothetical protein
VNYHTKNGVPMSKPLAMILKRCEEAGHEIKPLALGVRIKGTDVVASDSWKGLYLCKSGGRGLSRTENGSATLRPADKGQWCVSVASLATDDEGARLQAKDMMALCKAAGYFLPQFESAEEVVAEEVVAEEVVAEEVVAEEVVVASAQEVEPEDNGGRRKKGKKGKAKAKDAVDSLDEALAVLS